VALAALDSPPVGTPNAAISTVAAKWRVRAKAELKRLEAEAAEAAP
jgi:hypothetical protein